VNEMWKLQNHSRENERAKKILAMMMRHSFEGIFKYVINKT